IVHGSDFYNFQMPNRSALSNVSYTVIHGATTTTVSDLSGNTHQGDTVTVSFTVTTSTPTEVSLVAYNSPGPAFDATTASQQVIFAQASGTFTYGQHSLSVTLPANYYQVDFVLGDAITHFGPAGSNIFYTPQGRLVSADNGGTNPVPSADLAITKSD